MIDCLFVGMNSQNFSDYLGMVKGLGTTSGAYRDLNLSFIEYEGRAYQAMDLLSLFHNRHGGNRKYPFHNADFVWPTITYLGTYLHRQGLTFDFVNSFQYEKDALADKLTSEEVLVLAIPTTLYVVPWPIQEIIAFAREKNPKVKLVVGGPYISNLTKSGDRTAVEEQLRAIGADYYVISSEGEATFAALIKTLKEKGDLSKVDNLAYQDGAQFVFTKTVVETNALADNLVDYSLFPREAMGQFISTRTAKSCPFACAFCNFPQQAGAYTFTGVDLVEKELDAIRAIGGVTTVTFIDDTFNVPKKRFLEMLHMMIRNDYVRDFKWNCTLRSDHVDEEIVALMGKAGCEGVFLGVESGSDRMLKTMNKTARRKDYAWAIPALQAQGIAAHANIFIGFPGETLESVEETLDLIRTTKPETFSAQPWYANPLTPVWKKKEEYQIKGSSFKWVHKTMDAATACDLVDRVFLTVDESSFLPQYGFFQWSLFYLQRHGMSLGRIKGYLRAFNAVVREKMIGQVDPQVHAQLLANLEAASYFKDTDLPAPEALELYSGPARVASEAYCNETFGPIDRRINGRALAESLAPIADAFASTRVELPQAFAARFGAQLDDACLAACSVLLWQLDELGDAAVIVQGEHAVPVALRPSAESGAGAWVAGVTGALATAYQHRVHAFDILSGRSSLFSFHSHPVRFRAIFRKLGAAPLASEIEAHASHVLLDAAREDGAIELRGRCTPATLAAIGQSLGALLAAMADSRDLPLGGLIGSSRVPGDQPVFEHASETFAF